MNYQTDSISRPESLQPTAVVDGVTAAVDTLTPPRLRGWIHLYCAVAAFFAGSALVVMSWAAVSKQAGLATLAYALAIVAMFAVSAIYHRVHWESAGARKWMRRLDHSLIFVFIAGTYTPFATLAMPRATGHTVLTIVWGGALAGIAVTLFWPSAPRWVGVTLYLLLGWVAVWYGGMIVHDVGVTAAILLAVRRRAVQHWCAVLRAALARPVADDVRFSRVVPRLHRGCGHLPIHRHMVRGLLVGRKKRVTEPDQVETDLVVRAIVRSDLRTRCLKCHPRTLVRHLGSDLLELRSLFFVRTHQIVFVRAPIPLLSAE